MTREEEIIQVAKQKEKEIRFTQIVKEAKGVNSAYGIGFLEGAEWADRSMIDKVEAYVSGGNSEWTEEFMEGFMAFLDGKEIEEDEE